MFVSVLILFIIAGYLGEFVEIEHDNLRVAVGPVRAVMAVCVVLVVSVNGRAPPGVDEEKKWK